MVVFLCQFARRHTRDLQRVVVSSLGRLSDVHGLLAGFGDLACQLSSKKGGSDSKQACESGSSASESETGKLPLWQANQLLVERHVLSFFSDRAGALASTFSPAVGNCGRLSANAVQSSTSDLLLLCCKIARSGQAQWLMLLSLSRILELLGQKHPAHDDGFASLAAVFSVLSTEWSRSCFSCSSSDTIDEAVALASLFGANASGDDPKLSRALLRHALGAFVPALSVIATASASASSSSSSTLSQPMSLFTDLFLLFIATPGDCFDGHVGLLLRSLPPPLHPLRFLANFVLPSCSDNMDRNSAVELLTVDRTWQLIMAMLVSPHTQDQAGESQVRVDPSLSSKPLPPADCLSSFWLDAAAEPSCCSLLGEPSTLGQSCPPLCARLPSGNRLASWCACACFLIAPGLILSFFCGPLADKECSSASSAQQLPALVALFRALQQHREELLSDPDYLVSTMAQQQARVAADLLAWWFEAVQQLFTEAASEAATTSHLLCSPLCASLRHAGFLLLHSLSGMPSAPSPECFASILEPLLETLLRQAERERQQHRLLPENGGCYLWQALQVRELWPMPTDLFVS